MSTQSLSNLRKYTAEPTIDFTADANFKAFLNHCEQFGIKVVYVNEQKLTLYYVEPHTPVQQTLVETPNIPVAKAEPSVITITRPGVFKKNNDIFVVKMNKDKTRLYALKLVEAPSTRLTETGKEVDFEFEYAKGVVWELTEADRMTREDARQYTIRYGRCIVCGRRLKVAESVERGIGPVCVKLINGD